jgi:hypothetical protein
MNSEAAHEAGIRVISRFALTIRFAQAVLVCFCMKLDQGFKWAI